VVFGPDDLLQLIKIHIRWFAIRENHQQSLLPVWQRMRREVVSAMCSEGCSAVRTCPLPALVQVCHRVDPHRTVLQSHPSGRLVIEETKLKATSIIDCEKQLEKTRERLLQLHPAVPNSHRPTVISNHHNLCACATQKILNHGVWHVQLVC